MANQYGTTSGSGGGMYPTAPTYKAPVYPTMPTYTSTPYRYEEELGLTMEAAAPFLAQLGTGLQRAYGQAFSDPFRRERAYGEAMEGYGKGLAGVMSQASQIGAQKYGQKFAGQEKAGLMNWETAMEKLKGDYLARAEETKAKYGLESQKYTSELQEAQRIREEQRLQEQAEKDKKSEEKLYYDRLVAAGEGYYHPLSGRYIANPKQQVGGYVPAPALQSLSTTGSYKPFDPSQW